GRRGFASRVRGSASPSTPTSIPVLLSLLFAFFLSATPAIASPTATDADLLASTEQAFAEGVTLRDDSEKARPAFARSALGYDELWKRGHHNPDVALNRANAHRLAGNLPASIASLNAGLAMNPWSRPLQVALEDARNTVGYPLTGDLAAQCRPPATTGISTRMSADEAWLIAGFLWLLLCGGVARFAMVRRPAWLLCVAACAVGLAILGAAWRHNIRERQHANAYPLVVLADDVVLRKGNADAYPGRLEAKLPRGVEARKLTERGGWIQIRLAGGVVGWVPKSLVMSDE
ncbi:MAG: hypothetical protein K8U57_14015, partial [Planctomycetes bacterium]|nr:hypothetical protein [Planctomycetota bacterium]